MKRTEIKPVYFFEDFVPVCFALIDEDSIMALFDEIEDAMKAEQELKTELKNKVFDKDKVLKIIKKNKGYDCNIKLSMDYTA